MFTDIKKILKSDAPKRWVFIGDSITHAPYSTHGHRDYTEIFKEFLTYDYERRTDIVINTAIGGNTSRNLLQGFEWRVASLKPDVVFIMIGMNDCADGNDISTAEFEDNLTNLCHKIIDLGSKAVIQTSCPIIDNEAKGRVPYFYCYMDSIRAISKKLKLPIIDHAIYWQNYELSRFNMMNDAIHPNQYGHRLFARLILEKFGMYTDKSDVTSRYIPLNIKYKMDNGKLK